jgi:hypothetical protein
LEALAAEAGVSQAAVNRFGCSEYSQWVATGTAQIESVEGFQGTPWVLIGDGASYYAWNWSGGDLAQAIENVANGIAP